MVFHTVYILASIYSALLEPKSFYDGLKNCWKHTIELNCPCQDADEKMTQNIQ